MLVNRLHSAFCMCIPQLCHCFTCVHERLKSNDAGYGKQATRLTLSQPSAMSGQCQFQDFWLSKDIYKDWFVCNTAQLRSGHPCSLIYLCQSNNRSA